MVRRRLGYLLLLLIMVQDNNIVQTMVGGTGWASRMHHRDSDEMVSIDPSCNTDQGV